MNTNPFIPAGLPLVSDYTLLCTVSDYRFIYSTLEAHCEPSEEHRRVQLQEALEAIEKELCSRGIGTNLAPSG